MAKFEQLLGKTLTSVEVKDDKTEVTFVTAEGETFLMYHEQDCCESVDLEDVNGDWTDVIGSPILRAECSESEENPADANPATIEYQESFTWTFYKLATIKGSVDFRWYGSSNGYYSETVNFRNTSDSDDRGW